MSQATAVELSDSIVPTLNITFPIQGTRLPSDHGYLLYSAISRAFPTLHSVDWFAIELISGFPSGSGLITLPERDATLRLRIPAGHYRDVLPLAGKRLDISGHQIRLGLPVARPLEMRLRSIPGRGPSEFRVPPVLILFSAQSTVEPDEMPGWI